METLLQGDCIEVMQSLPSESIDMIFADPPFNVGKKYGGKAKNDRMTPEQYYEWCYRWIEEGYRLLKPTGTFYLMTIPRHVFKMGRKMEELGMTFINKVEWRNVSASHMKRRFWNSTQPICVFGKTENYTFYTYAQTRKIEKKNMRWGGYATEPKGQLLDYWDDIPFVYAGSVHHKEAILIPGTNKKAHPAQMPRALATRCILFSTNPCEVVLDPFNGSGTTGEACIENGRDFIGIEREAEYVEMTLNRWAKFRETQAIPVQLDFSISQAASYDDFSPMEHQNA